MERGAGRWGRGRRGGWGWKSKGEERGGSKGEERGESKGEERGVGRVREKREERRGGWGWESKGEERGGEDEVGRAEEQGAEGRARGTGGGMREEEEHRAVQARRGSAFSAQPRAHGRVTPHHTRRQVRVHVHVDAHVRVCLCIACVGMLLSGAGKVGGCSSRCSGSGE